MKSRSSSGARRASSGGTDSHSLETALAASSLMLWIPSSLAAVYMAYCNSFVPEPPSTSAGFSRSARTVRGSAYHYIFPVGFDIAIFVPLLLRVLLFSAVAIAVTFYLSVYKHNGGEYLMAVAWALGTFSGFGWLNASNGWVLPSSPALMEGDQVTANPTARAAALTPWLWLGVSLLTGLFSGILCKVMDIVDGKHDGDTRLFTLFDRSEEVPILPRRLSDDGDRVGDNEEDFDAAQRLVAVVSPTSTRLHYRHIRVSTSHPLGSLGDRLYMVVPFCTGQWFSFILVHGWRGIILENGTILLSLSFVGYAMLSYKLLKRQVLRVSGRVTRSATARNRNLRNQRRLQRRQRAAKPVEGVASGAADDASAMVSEETLAPQPGGGDALDGSAGATPPNEEVAVTHALTAADYADDVGEVTVVDVIDLISKLFTTSFGVVVLVVVGVNLFMTFLCIPFVKALLRLNALVSALGIVIELIMYEVA